VFKEFQDLVRKDFKQGMRLLSNTCLCSLFAMSGQMYGFEKLWALLKYRKSKEAIEIDADLQQELLKFKTADDFHSIATRPSESKMFLI
jgi:hypothetical protein